MPTSLLRRPPLAFEHLEHCNIFGARGIAFNLLQPPHDKETVTLRPSGVGGIDGMMGFVHHSSSAFIIIQPEA